MALLLKRLWQNYNYAFYELADPRTKDLPFVNSEIPVLMVLTTYLLFVKKLGPNLIQNRKPYKLQNVLIFYNALQVIVSVYLVIGVAPVIITYNIFCTNLTEIKDGGHIQHFGYIYMWLKVVDLLDTIFFILRKKERQVTFLHVYHHSGMVVLAWIGMRFLPAGQSIYIPLINSFVHSIMYSYYLITAWNKGLGQSLWWKKYITQLQLIQFGLFCILYTTPFISNCGYPLIVCLLLQIQFFLMLFLFGDFYYRTYIKKSVKTL